MFIDGFVVGVLTRICPGSLAPIAVAAALLRWRAVMSTFTDLAGPAICRTVASDEVPVQAFSPRFVCVECIPVLIADSKVVMTTVLCILHNDEFNIATFFVSCHRRSGLNLVAEPGGEVVWLLKRVIFCMTVTNAKL